MSITKQIPLIQKTNAYSWRGINPTGASAAADVPVCTNGYFSINNEALEDIRKVAYCKRPGVTDFVYATVTTNLKCTSSGERVRGICTNLDKTKILYYTQDATDRWSNIWDSATDTRTSTSLTATFTAGDYVFTVLDNINYGTNVNYASTNGTDGALINSSGVWSKITDADYTGNGTKTNFVGLNGYLFYGVISGTNAGRIYNSDTGAAAAATGWTATSYLSANDVPGQIVWLARLRNLIVCFKQFSIEFFEDVGNPTPGSPLEPRRALTKRIGCATASSIQEVSDGIIFIGIDPRGKTGVYKLERDSLNIKKISDVLVDISLQNALANVGGYRSYSADYVLNSSIRGQSQVIIFADKELYTTIIPSAWDGTPITAVYDNDLDLWYRWNTSFGANATQDATFIPSQCFLLNNNNGGLLTCFVNNYSGNGTSRFSLMYVNSATASPKAYQDQYDLSGTWNNFVFSWQSDFIDLGTTDKKVLHAIDVLYDSDPDQTVASATTFTLSLYHYDKDYNQAVAGPRNVTIDNAGFRRGAFRQLGVFRRKAFRLLSASAYPLRIWGIEMIVDNGPDNA